MSKNRLTWPQKKELLEFTKRLDIVVKNQDANNQKTELFNLISMTITKAKKEWGIKHHSLFGLFKSCVRFLSKFFPNHTIGQFGRNCYEPELSKQKVVTREDRRLVFLSSFERGYKIINVSYRELLPWAKLQIEKSNNYRAMLSGLSKIKQTNRSFKCLLNYVLPDFLVIEFIVYFYYFLSSSLYLVIIRFLDKIFEFIEPPPPLDRKVRLLQPNAPACA